MDYNATTYLRKEILEIPNILSHYPLNPSSIHSYGMNARNLLEDARKRIINVLNIDSSIYDLVFTSSGTESNNTVLSSFITHPILISSTEHLSTYVYQKNSTSIHTVQVDTRGLVDLNNLSYTLKKIFNFDATYQDINPILISTAYANSETGVITNVNEINEYLRLQRYKDKVVLHIDCVQAIGKIFVDIKSLDLDYCTISSHKIGGPLGIAILIFKKRHQHQLKPMMVGGGQEKGIRSGTENVVGAVQLSYALEIAISETQRYYNYTKALRDVLEDRLKDKAIIVSQKSDRLPNTTLIIMPGVDSQTQLMFFDMQGFAVSNGSACSSGKTSPSHVLTAMGYNDELSQCAIRVSLGMLNTENQIHRFASTWLDLYDSYHSS